jgi:hypothetical protein
MCRVLRDKHGKDEKSTSMYVSMFMSKDRAREAEETVEDLNIA